MYRHYTDKIYQVITIAKHSETEERLVIFQALYGTFDVYASPLSQFMSEVDHQKYPRIEQQYWFERIEKAAVGKTGQQLAEAKGNKQIRQDDYTISRQAGLLDNGVQDGSLQLYAGLKQDEQPAESSYDSRQGLMPNSGEHQLHEEWEPGSRQRPEWDRHLQQTEFEREPGIQRQIEDPIRRQESKSSWQQIKRESEMNRQAERQDSRADAVTVSHVVSGDSSKKIDERPRTQSPADSKRAYREDANTFDTESGYLQKRRRQLAERENRRGQFRKLEKQESATDELRANPNLLKFLDADTFEKKYQVLNEIQDDVTDRLIDDIAVVLDVVIPEGPLHDRYSQLKNIILTRQKYEISRFR